MAVVGDARRVLVFVNPRAGRGAAGALIDELVNRLGRREFVVERTDEIDELRQIVASSGDGLRAIVSAGGDGTAETVVNVTSDVEAQGGESRQTPIAVLPLGTENLLAKYLGVRPDPEQIADMITAGHTCQLDAGVANGKMFLLMLSCGFDADVVQRLHRDRQGNISHLAYAMPMIDAIRNYDYPNLQVGWETTEGWQERDCHWAFCFNAPSYAAGLRIAPDADPSDGLLDLATFAGGSFWHGLWQFSAVVLGQHRQLPEFEQSRSRRIRISSDRANVPYQVDGDPGGVLPVDIEILPRHLTLVARAD